MSLKQKLLCFAAVVTVVFCTSSLAGTFAPGAAVTAGHGASVVSADSGLAGFDSGHEQAVELEDSEPEVPVHGTGVGMNPRTSGWRAALPAAIAERIDEGEPNPD